jgi:hypothetical protein
MKKTRLGSVGASLVELAIAMVVGSVVLSTAFQAQRYFSLSAARERDKTFLQQDIMAAGEVIGHDIRMGGYGLPGRGIDVQAGAVSNDQLIIYVNDSLRQTTLLSDVNATDSILRVANADGIQPHQWICLAGSDTVYREIILVKSSSCPDTICLSATLGHGPFTTSNTIAYYASRICYSSDNATQKLTRFRNGISMVLSCRISSLQVTPKDADGSISAAPYHNARTITVIIGGTVGKGSSSVLQWQNLEFALKNIK